MNSLDYEELVLCATLLNPENIKMLASELSSDKFSGSARRLIYEAMIDLHIGKVPIDIPTIVHQLGDRAEKAGGEAYLLQLKEKYAQLGVESSQGLESWARVVDAAGRLRHVQTVMTEYQPLYGDFERLVTQVEDVDEFVAGMVAKIQTATSGKVHGYRHISEAATELELHLEAELKGRQTSYVDCGLPTLMANRLFPLSALSIISGLSSMGKTSLCLQVALGVAIKLKENDMLGCVSIHELESTVKAWRLTKRMASMLSGIPWSKIESGRPTNYENVRYREAIEFIKTLPIYINDSDNQTSAQVITTSNALHMQSGPLWLSVSDYLEQFRDQMATDGKQTAAEEQRVSRIGRNHVTVASQTGASVILISQVTIDERNNPERLAGASNLLYSRALEHAADVVGEIYNPPQMRRRGIKYILPRDRGITDDKLAWFCLWKYRDGATGVFPMGWVPETTTFVDPLLNGQVFQTSLFGNGEGDF